LSDTYLVYKHIAPNGKVYIGITSQLPEKRWNGGCNYSGQPYFYNAIKKYGWESFEHVIIRDGLTEEEAKIAERKLIKHYDSRNRDKGYNRTPGGDISPMKDPVVRRKSAESHRGKHLSDEHKEHLRQAFKGRVISEETRKKTSESIKQLWQDPEHRAKHIAAAKTRSVAAYDKEGEMVLLFDSITQAGIETGSDVRNIQACCKGRKRTAGGYVWRYVDEQVNTEVSAETKASA